MTINAHDQSPSNPAHPPARHIRSRRLLVVAVAAAAAAGTAYTAASASPPNRQPKTPNQCITLNGGDYNACNVGNSGRGDLPYRPLDH